MAIPNHANLIYRPLRGGIAILNPIVQQIGTLGFIATSDGLDRWLVSCYHVLGRIDKTVFNDGEPIYQTIDNPGNFVAKVYASRADAVLDCAAAKLESGIPSSGQVLELPQITGVCEPVIGMRVIKSGCVTGVTEGVITSVNGDDLQIGIAPGFPTKYELSKEGDSGALWVSANDGKAVALHRAGDAFGNPISYGIRLNAVIASLQLQIVIN